MTNLKCRLKKLKTGDRVSLEWLDSYAARGSVWIDKETLQDMTRGRYVGKTSALFLQHDEHYITVCHSMIGAGGADPGYAGVFSIPIAAIIKMKGKPASG